MFKFKISDFVYIISFIFGYAFGFWLFNDSPSRLTLASITAWWMSLYVGALFDFRLHTVFCTVLIYFIFSLFDVIFQLGLLTEDAIDNVLGYIFILVTGLIFLLSPIMINYIFFKIRTRGFKSL